jgi:drug/metabolite transporter (DMT)-like permease
MLRDGVSSWFVADLLALVAACLFALASTLQQKGALGMGDVSLGKPSSFVRLAKQTWWLFGTLALLAGYVFQAVALDRAKLAVIQPLLVTTIVFALPLGYLLTQQHVNREQVVAAGLVVLGLGFFIVVGKAASGNDNAPSWEWAVVIVVLGVASALLVVFGGRGSLARKAAAFGACAGLLYGLSASLWKPTADILDADGVGGMLSNWEFWAFPAAGVLAFLVQQVSLATCRLAPSVAMTSVLNPLVGILVGTLLLDERLADPTSHKAVAYAGLGLALAAAVTITRATEEAKPAVSVDVDSSSVATPAT